MAESSVSLYKSVIAETYSFLGPATERFIDKQITNHLHKNPSELTADDIPQLSEWLRTSMSLLTEDRQAVDAYISKLHEVAKQ